MAGKEPALPKKKLSDSPSLTLRHTSENEVPGLKDLLATMGIDVEVFMSNVSMLYRLISAGEGGTSVTEGGQTITTRSYWQGIYDLTTHRIRSRHRGFDWHVGRLIEEEIAPPLVIVYPQLTTTRPENTPINESQKQEQWHIVTQGSLPDIDMQFLATHEWLLQNTSWDTKRNFFEQGK